MELCRRTLGGRGDAEALGQESFVRAWASLDHFHGGRPFCPWVATIARRLCLDSLRRLEREQASRPAQAAAGPPARPPDPRRRRRPTTSTARPPWP